MKKLIAILLAVAMMAAMGTVASAEENTMQLKTTVPAATYTLYIPATMEVPYGAEEVTFPLPEVVESAGFIGKDLRIDVWDPVFFGEGTSYVLDMQVVANVHGDREPFNLIDGAKGVGYSMFYIWANNAEGRLESDCYVIYEGERHLLDDLSLLFNKADWAYLEPGEHTGHIVFRSNVVPNVTVE